MTDLFKALAHPLRRDILTHLRVGPLSAGALADRFDVSKPTMSGHFAVLRAAGLIRAERSGTTLTYHLQLSVLEDGLAGAMDLFGIGQEQGTGSDAKTTRG
ncbi:ArsR family transcriptional regulator [Rhodobacteraceae bacterium CCMM004]|nr:ArsR family transcriptional regulator [Rhodobacteraceae bacterium CCMM004]